jgi:hypothetical protein
VRRAAFFDDEVVGEAFTSANGGDLVHVIHDELPPHSFVRAGREQLLVARQAENCRPATDREEPWKLAALINRLEAEESKEVALGIWISDVKNRVELSYGHLAIVACGASPRFAAPPRTSTVLR